MTANPKRPEIQEAVLKFQVSTDNEQVEAGGQANEGQEQPEQGQEQAQPRTCTQWSGSTRHYSSSLQGRR